ncbi:MAG TPA: hypothetical protein VEC75_01300 [Stellaceae bacterium]|nr:hypothetical protein [Stellaceae bacterium]
MRERPLRISFSDLWSMRIEHPYSLLVRAGEHAWTCGQCPLSADGAVLEPDDLMAQAAHVEGYIRRLLDKADYSPESAGKLVIYHAPDTAEATRRMLALFRSGFPSAILMPLGTPYFYYPGMRIEVDVHAAERRAPLVTQEQRGFRLQAVEAGSLIWVSLEVLRDGASDLDAAALREALGRAGVSAETLFAEHWFVGGEAAAGAIERLAHAGLVADPGAAVSVSLPSGTVAIGELTFAGGSAVERLATPADPGIVLVGRRNREHFWIAARCRTPAPSLVGETSGIMAAIASEIDRLGRRFESVTKATTHYVGSSSAEDLHDNMAVRNAYYRRPGPASTGLPVAGFPFSRGRIAVDVLGLARP